MFSKVFGGIYLREVFGICVYKYWLYYFVLCLHKTLRGFINSGCFILSFCGIISSVRSSSGYHGLLRTYPAQQQPTFSDFSNSSDSKVKVKVKGPNMCYIFEKHGIQGYRI